MNPSNITLSPHDIYGLARALVGLSWDHVALSPVVALLLGHLDPNIPDDMRFLRKVLGQELLREVLAVDPNGPAPEPPHRAADLNIVPDLPEEARLSPDQMTQAQSVGKWLDDYLQWASASANETPMAFHLGAGLYLAAVAVGRRLYIQTPWRQKVFPNLYLMIVAVSTYYRKSAGLNLASEVARMAIPHMLMPQPGSPENFMSMLGGVLPPNFSDIPQEDRARLEKGNRYAAQRGLLRDELSGLFKSINRDYMAGMKELIMNLYDCPPYLDSNTNNKGLVVIRDSALSILGAATPAELATALTSADWFNGNLARFALITPETDYAERPAPQESQKPTDLANRLKRLHEKLPEPPLPDALGQKESSEAWSLSADFWDACHAYEKSLRAMTAPNSSLDDRLRAIYGRLHVQAIKVAILLAALDWSDNPSEARPRVTAAHWYRAQIIAEEWRASAHRLLADLGENEEGRLESRILGLLKAASGSATVRDIYRALRAPRKAVLETLKALEDDGRVMRVQDAYAGRGRPPEKYELIETNFVTPVT